MQQRPVGVTILAVLALLGGGIALLGALGSLVGGAVANNPAMQAQIQGAMANAAQSGQQVPDNAAALASSAGPLLMILGLVLLVQGVLSLAFGIGALGLKPWAWTLGIATQALGVLTTLWLATRSGFGGGTIFNLIIAGVIVWYLFTPTVRRAFGQDVAASAV
jgi:hypothetical protein